MSAEQTPGALVVKKVPARDRIWPSDFSTHDEYREALRYQERQEKIAQRILELKRARNIGDLLTSQAIELSEAAVRLEETKQAYEDMKAPIRELAEILEVGGSIIVRPKEGESFKVWHTAGSGYYDADYVTDTIEYSGKFVGNYIRWDTLDKPLGQLKLYGGMGRSSWVNLEVNEDSSVNFIIDEVILPEIIVE